MHLDPIPTPDAMAQALIAEYGREGAIAALDTAFGATPEYWRDVATLLRLETQSDETPEEAADRIAGEELDAHMDSLDAREEATYSRWDEDGRWVDCDPSDEGAVRFTPAPGCS